MGAGHLVTLVRTSKWLLSRWLHRGRSQHFVWEMIFLWRWYPRNPTCSMTILSNGLHRFACFFSRWDLSCCFLMKLKIFPPWIIIRHFLLYAKAYIVDINSLLSFNILLTTFPRARFLFYLSSQRASKSKEFNFI